MFTRFIRQMKIPFSAVMLCLATIANAGELKVFELFTDHGILQQDTDVPIWGTADPGVNVTVSFRDVTATAVAGKDGKWMVRLKTPKAQSGQKGTELVISAGDKKITLKDMLVGEVWLGSGQSNMDTSLGGYAAAAKEELPKADYPEIRLYAGGGWSHTGDFSKCKWNLCTPETAKNASATGYFFCKELHQTLKVPVGFVMMGYSGSSMAMFVEADWLKADQRTAQQYEKWFQQDFPKAVEKRKESLAKWEKDVADAKAKGEKNLPRRPFNGPAEVGVEAWVGRHFQTHIQPVMPFAFRGILWDQGEAGVGISVSPYDTVFEIMIREWRKGFGQNLPVIYCQMPKGGAWGPLAKTVDKKTNETGSEIPLADLPVAAPGPGKVFDGFAKEDDPFARMMALEKSWMAVTRDLCVAVHPPDKANYAHRFFLTAAKNVYGLDVEWFGPVMKSAKREGAGVRVSFDHVGGGLDAPGGKQLQGFVLTGKEKGTGKLKSVWAECKIDGQTVVLSSGALESVDTVSYAPGGRVMWANLFNKDGLPAYPMTLKAE